MLTRFAGSLVASVVLAAAALLTPAALAGTAPGACTVLSTSTLPLSRLEASYRKLTQLPAGTPLSASGPRRYGVCGQTHYAFAPLSVARGVHLTYREQVAQQDHSPIWRKRPGRGWVDEGLDDLCNLAPHALINAWHVGATCR